MTDCEVFRITGTLRVLVKSTTVEFDRMITLILLLLLLLLFIGLEVLCTETDTLVMELFFRVTIGI